MAIIHDLSMTVKMVITQTELLDQDNSLVPPRKKESGQKKYTILNNSDYPAIRITEDEWKTRVSDMMTILYYGFRADPLDSPAIVETDDASSIAATTATLNGRVTGAGCTTGFEYGTTRALGTSVAATQSPTGAVETILSMSYPLTNLVTKTRYYFRCWAAYTTTGNKQYGMIRSFKTL
jgi:hypothetical protein